MGTPKIILFYVFTPLTDPEAVMVWQRELAQSAGVTGRIIVSPHGINATVGGDIIQVKSYIRGLRKYKPFAKARLKWSDGQSNDFPRLSVKVRPELVSFGKPDEIIIDDNGVVGGGERISPHQLHDFVKDHDDVVFFDGRNKIESALGRFKNSYAPQIETTREFIDLLDSGEIDHLKDKTIITYCTGGIRCELLTVHMRKRGFKNVYQLDGGIIRYGEQYGDSGLWEGTLYVFDNRMSMAFSDEAKVLARCEYCGVPTNTMSNFPNINGRNLIVMCSDCQDKQIN